MLLQTLVGTWPAAPEADYAARVKEWQEKAVREAKLHSSWAKPNEEYEGRLSRLIDDIVTGAKFEAVREAVAAFLARIGTAARVNGLLQPFLRCACPGVPDLYQGAELADLSLVDPDNRRPVDYSRRAKLLAERGDEKQALVRDMLALRRDHAAAFQGSCRPLSVAHDPDGRIIAFARGEGDHELLFAARRLAANGQEDDWWGAAAVGGSRLRELVTRGKSLLGAELPLAVFRSSELPERPSSACTPTPEMIR